jgi:hypothetical protein
MGRTAELISWIRILIERLIVTQLITNVSYVYGTKVSLLCSKEHENGHNPQPDKSRVPEIEISSSNGPSGEVS